MLKNNFSHHNQQIHEDNSYKKGIYDICYFIDDTSGPIMSEWVGKQYKGINCKCSEEKDTSPCIVNLNTLQNNRLGRCISYVDCNNYLACYAHEDDSSTDNMLLQTTRVVSKEQYLKDCNYKFRMYSSEYKYTTYIYAILALGAALLSYAGIILARSQYKYVRENVSGDGTIENYDLSQDEAVMACYTTIYLIRFPFIFIYKKIKKSDCISNDNNIQENDNNQNVVNIDNVEVELDNVPEQNNAEDNSEDHVKKVKQVPNTIVEIYDNEQGTSVEDKDIYNSGPSTSGEKYTDSIELNNLSKAHYIYYLHQYNQDSSSEEDDYL